MLNTSEKVVSIAAGLYDMRRLLLSTVGEKKFREMLEAFKPLFVQVEKANKCSTLQAMKLIITTQDGDPVRILQVCAVAVEIMEPSLRPPERVTDADG